MPRVGDRVLYVPECDGDRCKHEPIHDRAAIVTKVVDETTVWLAVLHPGSLAHVPDVPRGGPGRLRTWYPRVTTFRDDEPVTEMAAIRERTSPAA